MTSFCPSCKETLTAAGRHRPSLPGSIKRIRREQKHRDNPTGKASA